MEDQIKHTCCSIEGCQGKGARVKDKVYFTNGFCTKHNQRFVKYGDPNHKHEPATYCKIQGCNGSGSVSRHGKEVFKQGLCAKHYDRMCRRGDPEAAGKVCERGNNVKKHPLYSTWASIRNRTSSPSNEHYQHYGARGIELCDRWSGINGFMNFVADMGPRPSDLHSVERRDNDKGYSPDNCIWGNRHEQSANRRDNNRVVGVGWAKTKGMWYAKINVNHVQFRLGHFKLFEDAVKARKDAEKRFGITYSNKI